MEFAVVYTDEHNAQVLRDADDKEIDPKDIIGKRIKRIDTDYYGDVVVFYFILED